MILGQRQHGSGRGRRRHGRLKPRSHPLACAISATHCLKRMRIGQAQSQPQLQSGFVVLRVATAGLCLDSDSLDLQQTHC